MPCGMGFLIFAKAKRETKPSLYGIMVINQASPNMVFRGCL